MEGAKQRANAGADFAGRATGVSLHTSTSLDPVREADLVLGPFVEQIGPSLSEAALDELEALLHSRSWRLTRPLRETVLLLARLRRVLTRRADAPVRSMAHEPARVPAPAGPGQATIARAGEAGRGDAELAGYEAIVARSLDEIRKTRTP